ncbi:hypothetical protein JWS13_39175 [Rhodococcus pseudokoreensis]|uniref:Uncharacterized protein n=1 Tax=Rhodococcus pseudokoreensis TaxID=2811421 RepID=A0A974WAK9_9NOCA|nr:hypothetical protein [Rhodococcus pseudokoreensis]QSE94200.1 hypothetical protein JWS13_39175 [Rhodococcus pseudokoreensis]
MPWIDTLAYMRRAGELDAQRERDSENWAMLLDRIEYTLNSAYADRITDPDDPKVAAERARREMLGLKPPPMPLIRPVALRPPAIDEVRRQMYQEQVDLYKTPEANEDGTLSVAEYMRLRGIEFEPIPEPSSE